MALFSFQSRFAAPIRAGTKRQTIRARRKNLGSHGKVGGPITLVHGSRFKPVRLGSSVCTGVHGITLNLALGEVTITGGPEQGNHVALRIILNGDGGGALDAFAVSDGFLNWSDLCGFWAKHHPGLTLFEGIVTRWGDLNP